MWTLYWTEQSMSQNLYIPHLFAPQFSTTTKQCTPHANSNQLNNSFVGVIYKKENFRYRTPIRSSNCSQCAFTKLWWFIFRIVRKHNTISLYGGGNDWMSFHFKMTADERDGHFVCGWPIIVVHNEKNSNTVVGIVHLYTVYVMC